jgi:hypothetical protein
VFALSETTLASSEEGLARIVQLLDRLRLPAVSDETDFTPGGGLMSLGPDFSANLQRVARDNVATHETC